MLTYSYKIQVNNEKEYINLNDFYVSPNLSYISGTTTTENALSVGDVLWVKSAYFPLEESVRVTSTDIVKRNGYVLYPYNVDINFEHLTYQNYELVNKKVGYVEYNGNIFFQDVNGDTKMLFEIEGDSYEADNSATTLTIMSKAYVEDNVVVVNDISYNITFDDDNIIFSDIEGNAYTPPSIWDISHILSDSEYVQKIEIGNQETVTYETKSVTSFGYRPYIIYNNNKMYLDYLIDDEGDTCGIGVVINNTNYPVYDDWESLYERTVFTPTLGIGPCEYEIKTEPAIGVDGNYVCLEMKNEHLPILLEDTLTLKTLEYTNKIVVCGDDYEDDHVFVNGEKYYRHKNLCDRVVIGESDYLISYQGDCSKPSVGMICSCVLDDDTTIYFKVGEVDEELGTVKSLKRVKNIDGDWVDCYTMGVNASGYPEYMPSKDYLVTSYDGIKIRNNRFPIVYDEGVEVIYANFPIQYKLRVVDTLGSNKLICEPANGYFHEYGNDYGMNKEEEIRSIANLDNYIVTKTPNLFGVRPMTPKEWVGDISSWKKSTSIYEMSGIKDDIRFERFSKFLSLPISLSKNVNNSLNVSNLIMSYHYDEKADETINEIVDVDKDIYTPVLVNGDEVSDVSKLIFNFHFRTRDLENWQIREGDDNFQDSPFSGFCNWFVTDYYPYNQYNNHISDIHGNNELLNKIMKRSDLLGYLYFTTNDVEEKRKKLTGSFLRLTFFDSKNPTKQNMLGTSTIFMDCDRYYDTIYSKNYTKNVVYNLTAESLNPNRIDGDSRIKDIFEINHNTKPTVLTECFSTEQGLDSGSTKDLYCDDDNRGYLPRLDSRMVVTDRYTSDTSSEGFYMYIIKKFANRTKPQTIYMKAEFFHAGVGIKIPMVIATDEYKNAIETWNEETLAKFKEGYELSEVYDRLYIPITIFYDRNLRRYVYAISDSNNYSNAIKDGNKLIFNLFELKIKTK